jgi:hypothetical protein
MCTARLLLVDVSFFCVEMRRRRRLVIFRWESGLEIRCRNDAFSEGSYRRTCGSACTEGAMSRR